MIVAFDGVVWQLAIGLLCNSVVCSVMLAVISFRHIVGLGSLRVGVGYKQSVIIVCEEESANVGKNQNLQTAQAKLIPPTHITKPFSILEILVGAAFSGFEGSLIAIATLGLVNSPAIALVISTFILSGLIFSQTKRWIEKSDLLIIPAITFAVIFFVPLLQGNLGIKSVIILSLGGSLAAIALTSLFRLIYKLLSLLL